MLILLGWCGLIALVGWTLRSAWSESSTETTIGWTWWVLASVVLVCFRWELILAPFEFSPDEAQLMAGALTLRHEPMFWRSVDGFTAGPLVFYPLLPATLTIGLTSFTIARLIGLGGLIIAWMFAGASVAHLTNRSIARAAVLPALAFHAFTQSPDFLFYSTEIAPLCLLSAAAWVFVRQIRHPRRTNLWTIGLLLGAVPWSKLQATPIAAVMWVLVLVHELFRSNHISPHHLPKGLGSTGSPSDMPESTFSRTFIPLLAAGILPTLLVAVGVTATGQAHHLLIPYFLNNVGYVQGAPLSLSDAFWRQVSNATGEGYFAWWFGGAAVYSVLLVRAWRSSRSSLRAGYVGAMLLLGAAILSILMPQRDTGHYLYLLELPVILISGLSIAIISLRGATSWTAVHPRAWAAVFLSLAFVPQLVWAAAYRAPIYDTNPNNLSAARRDAAATLRSYAQPGEALGIWGWCSALYIDTGLVQATREGQTQPQIIPGRCTAYFRNRYMDDLAASNPPVFVDAVGPGNYMANRKYAHESFPRLAEWLEKHYSLVREANGLRIYVRSDRLPPAQRPHG